jgi:hypothetical protein
MDHRISIAIVAVFGAVLGFTFLIASLTSTVKPDHIQAVFGAEASERAVPRSGPAPRRGRC